MGRDEARRLLRDEMGRNYLRDLPRLLKLLRRVDGVYRCAPARGRRAFGDPVGDLVSVLEDLAARAEIAGPE